MTTPKSSPASSAREIVSGNWFVSVDQRKFSLCPHCIKILDIAGQEVGNIKNVFQLVDVSQRWKLLRDYKLAVSSRSSLDTQVKIVTGSGIVKWLNVTGVLSYRRWGQPEKMVGMIRDVTQRQAEETVSLSIINHELRTPLTVIKLNTQMAMNLLKNGYHPDAVKLLAKSEFFIDMMTRILEEYGTTGGGTDRVIHSKLTMFDIGQLIETVIAEIRILHPGYRFSTRLPENTFVRADKYKIVQVLVNYLTNAVNYSAINTLVTVNADQLQNKVVISVTDQGVGLPSGTEQLIFEKFYRGKDHVAGRGHKGLGLYLVKNIIEQHGGAVKACKGEVKGSVFSFTLPVAYEVK